jgi:hypothetical protein
LDIGTSGREEGIRKGGGGQICWRYFASTCEKRRMRPVQIVLRSREGGLRDNAEGGKSN